MQLTTNRRKLHFLLLSVKNKKKVRTLLGIGFMKYLWFLCTTFRLQGYINFDEPLHIDFLFCRFVAQLL